MYSVGQAARQQPRGVVVVSGYLVSPSDRPIRLCSRLRGPDPPRCGNPSLRADDAEIEAMSGLKRSDDGSAWSPRPVRLVGFVQDDRLYIEEVHR